MHLVLVQFIKPEKIYKLNTSNHKTNEIQVAVVLLKLSFRCKHTQVLRGRPELLELCDESVSELL
jgi:hypothetical protein